MTILIIGIVACGVTLGACSAVLAQDYWRQRQARRERKPILDWRPTLRMDARSTDQAELSEDDNVPANWTLRAEEIRLVESVSGKRRSFPRDFDPRPKFVSKFHVA